MIKFIASIPEKELTIATGDGTFHNKPDLTPYTIDEPENDFYGEFVWINGYFFKVAYGNYTCLTTPTEKHEQIKRSFGPKGHNDYYKK